MMHYALRIPHGKWLLCLSICLGALALTCWPQGVPLFRYDRAALADGEIWRLASAHLVHLNGVHWLLNVIGLMLICELLWRDLPLRHGAGLLASAAIGVSGLLWYAHPALAWYAGLSAALHGLWSGCALASMLAADARLMQREKPGQVEPATSYWLGLGGLILLILKLLVESYYGASQHLIQAIGAPVATISHVYGAIVGACYVVLWRGLAVWRRKN